MQVHANTIAPPHLAPQSAIPPEGARVLVVDDDEAVRGLLADILRSRRFDATLAATGAEALELVRAQRFDLVMADLKMPGVSGFDLLRAVKALDPLIGVIIVTGYPSIPLATEAMRLGAVDFVVKPLETQTIDQTLRRALRERALMLQNRRLQNELDQKAVIEALNRQLHDKIDELTKLYGISELMGKALDNDTLLEEIVALAAEITGARRVSLMVVDRDRGDLVVRAAIGMAPELMRSVRPRIGEGVAGAVVLSKRPVRTDRSGVATPLASEAAAATTAERPASQLADRPLASSVPEPQLPVWEAETGEQGSAVANRRAKLKNRKSDSRDLSETFAPQSKTKNQISRMAPPSTPRYEHHSYLSAPILVGDDVFGVLNLTDKPDGSPFTSKDEELIVNLAQKAAIKLENNALYEGLYANLIDTLRSLVITIEARDPYTHSHSQRVTEYALVLGQRLGLGDEDLEMLRFCGIIHDIGKIGVQDRILRKTGPLTAREFDSIKQHPTIGETIVQPLGLIDAERAIIRHHHERLDGSGYPDGLRGERIPLTVRILSVADAFDAMTSDRPYRQAMPVADALAELRRCAGTQFDPGVVRALIEAIAEGAVANPDLPDRLAQAIA